MTGGVGITIRRYLNRSAVPGSEASGASISRYLRLPELPNNVPSAATVEPIIAPVGPSRLENGVRDCHYWSVAPATNNNKPRRRWRLSQPSPLPLFTAPSATTGAVTAEPSRLECGICFDATKDCAFECGHMSCFKCAESLQTCHICRAKIEDRRRVYL